jgi:hypothetical protein
MQPILAEPAPHRGRAIAFAIALALVATLAATQTRRHPRHHHRHYELQQRIGKCAQVHYSSYVYTR